MLDSLHRMGAMHHDIKPDNILVSSDGHLVLADFSIGRLVDGDHKSFVGWQPWYGAPECMGIDYDVKPGHAADVWSMGVCILEMYCHSAGPLFDPKRMAESIAMDDLAETLLMQYLRGHNPPLWDLLYLAGISLRVRNAIADLPLPRR